MTFLVLNTEGLGKTCVKYLNVDTNMKCIYMDTVLRGRTKGERVIFSVGHIYTKYTTSLGHVLHEVGVKRMNSSPGIN
jgi:hypothetical protein